MPEPSEGVEWGLMGLGALSCNRSRAVVRTELALHAADTPRLPPPEFSSVEGGVCRIWLIISYLLV